MDAADAAPLPDGWSVASLNDCIASERPICYGILKPGKGHPGGVPVIKVKNIKGGRIQEENLLLTSPEIDEAFRRSRLRGGDVLLSIRGTTGRLAIVPDHLENANITQDTARISVGDSLDTSFIFYNLQSRSLQRQIAHQTIGQAVKGINIRDVRRLELLVPPLPEQRKIAAILSSVDEAIEATQAVIDQVQVVKKGLMQELLTKGLPGRHKKFKQTEIGQIPEAWEVVTYGELAADVPRAIQSGPFGSALKHSEFVAAGRLVIGIDNVLDGRFSPGAQHRISQKKFDELSRFQARPGDLLITVMATVGRCCVVPDDIEDAIITKHVYRLTVDQKRANPYFLMQCLYGIKHLDETLHGSAQGLSRPGLNKALLLPLPFPLPTRSEQDEIVSVLHELDVRIDREQAVLVGFGDLKKGLMSVLLTGELRVQPEATS